MPGREDNMQMRISGTLSLPGQHNHAELISQKQHLMGRHNEIMDYKMLATWFTSLHVSTQENQDHCSFPLIYTQTV